MKTSHAGLGITESDWQSTVNHLVATLDKFKVPEKEKGELLAIASSLKPDIVEKKVRGRRSRARVPLISRTAPGAGQDLRWSENLCGGLKSLLLSTGSAGREQETHRGLLCSVEHAQDR